MTAIKAKNLDGKAIELDGAWLTDSKPGLRGMLLREGDHGYEDSRTVWNAMIDRKPALVARCLGTGDVVSASTLSASTILRSRSRVAGHNIAGLAACDGGLMMDMSLMRGVVVDKERSIAHAQAGCILGDVDRETQLHGLAAVIGSYPTPASPALPSAVGLDTSHVCTGGLQTTRRQWRWSPRTAVW